MTDDGDEPLEGDIGPASVAGGTPEGERESRAEELERYEREREERRRRNNAVAGRVSVILIALLLAFLAYDGISNAVKAHDRGDAWLYPPGTVALVCLLGLAGLGAWALRRRR
ncbi:hypothetical protein J4573_09810 [Actinomadura barringtoniae]|uniref:Uncharacterized protein n=1 Tax=Actinomadura barringtoniae TaxID=1427535 RepID=A0A939P7Y4_9ACTN|nr:hypothetical protein [Actinomadura barringtoniae]MBO2447380.1 hypothetical protein [Actinomadura barringtoniae]